MGRNFDDASSQDLSLGSGILSAEPITMCGWFKTDDLDANQVIAELGNNGSSGAYRLILLAGSAGDPVRATKQQDSGANGHADTTSGPSVSTWHHGLATFTSDTRRDSYLDGGSSGSNTSSVADPTPDFTNFGVDQRDAKALFWSGDLAHGAFWAAVLTANQISAMSRGVNPFGIDPANRKMLVPMDGHESPEPDYDQQNHMTLTNGPTKSSTNPPVELLENYL